MQPPRPEERRHTKPAPLRDAILAAITAAGERGMSQPELREQLNIKPSLLTSVICQYKAAGYVHAVGPQMHRRYFTDAQLAEAAAGRVEQEVAQRAAAAAEQLRAQRREIERRQAERRRDGAELVRLRNRVAELEHQLEHAQSNAGAQPADQAGATGGPAPRHSTAARPSPMRDLVLGAVEGAGICGMTQRQLCEQLRVDRHRMSALLAQYKAAGHLYSAGPRMNSRYFTSAKLAAEAEPLIAQVLAKQARDAAEARREQRRLAQQQAPRQRPARPTARRGADLVAKQPLARPAPVRVAEEQRRPQGEVIVPATVKRTVVPAPAGRFEATGPVIGGFATMRPGQYLPESGFSSYLDGGAR